MIKPLSSTQPPDNKNTAPTYYVPEKKRSGERLMRNLALSGMLIITICAIRNHALPTGDTVLTAVQGAIEQDWSEDIGKISFVSTLFPDAVAVFGQSQPNVQLTIPCSGAISHAWSVQEPYLSYDAAGSRIFAVADGQVMSIGHGADEGRIVRIRHLNGLESLYYHLADTVVQEGDTVSAGAYLGTCSQDNIPLLEMRINGRPTDPTALLVHLPEGSP